jgi:16S rRNA (cytidine1402-2'-O)-methyltransferase
LLGHLGLHKPLISLHDHNERERVEMLMQRLAQGQSGALISDAGTPLISDPGYHLVRALRGQGLGVCPIPGPSALVCALSVAGLPTNRFSYEGFLPAKAAKRSAHLSALAADVRTLVFYESPHRLMDTLAAMIEAFGGEREICVAREMTKQYEQFVAMSLAQAQAYFLAHADKVRGEFVLVVAGAPEAQAADVTQWDSLIRLLLAQGLAVKSVSEVVASYFEAKKKAVYARVLALKSLSDSDGAE